MLRNLCRLFSTKASSKLSRRGGKKKNIKDPSSPQSSSCRKDNQSQCPAVERPRTCPPKPAPLFPITDGTQSILQL